MGVMPSKTLRYRNSKIFHATEIAKDKILKGDTNLERDVGICKDILKMFVPCCKLYYKNKESTVQTILIQRNKTL